MFFLSKPHLGDTMFVAVAWHICIMCMTLIWEDVYSMAEHSGYMKGIFLSQICSNLMVLLKTAGCVCCFLNCLNFCTAAGSFGFDQHHELKLKNSQTWHEYLIMETWTGSSLEEIMCKTHSFWFFYLSDNLKPIEEGTSLIHILKKMRKKPEILDAL